MFFERSSLFFQELQGFGSDAQSFFFGGVFLAFVLSPKTRKGRTGEYRLTQHYRFAWARVPLRVVDVDPEVMPERIWVEFFILFW